MSLIRRLCVEEGAGAELADKLTEKLTESLKEVLSDNKVIFYIRLLYKANSYQTLYQVT